MKSEEFGTWTLEDIIKRGFFRIPDYQRGYAWGERQLQEFWDDVMDVVSSGNRHYTGSITVERANGAEAGEVFAIVDGQQRMITMAILLSVLKHDRSPFIVNEGGETKFVLSYYANNTDHKFFEALIAGHELSDPVNSYQRNLKRAREYFESKTEGNTGLDAIANAVMQQLAFDFRILGDDFNSGIVFETMNNRGKPLTLLEKLKNRLMYLSGQVSGSSAASDPRTMINEAWGEIYNKLASDPKREPLDEDEFVASHLSVYRNPKDSVYSETVAEARLFKMFCAHPERYPKSEDVDEANERSKAKPEEKLTLQKISDYVKDLKAFAGAWAGIHKEFESECGQCRLLSGVREVKVFLAVVALKVKDDKKLRLEIYGKARQILFRNTIGAGMDKARFATLARQLHGTCIKQLKRGSRRQIYGDDLTKMLDEVLDNNRKKPTKQTVLNFFANRQKGDFYGWSEQGLRYFLMRHECDFSDRADRTPRLTWEMLENTSIEHILPQSSTNENSRGWRWWGRVMEDWESQCGLSEDADERKKAETRSALVNSLGNLVLLTRKENLEVSCKAWESYQDLPGKREFYLNEEHISSNGAVALASECEERNADGRINSWNAFRIRKRGQLLFKKLVEDFGVPSEEFLDPEIDKALGIVSALDGHELKLQDNPIEELTPEEVQRNSTEDTLPDLDLEEEDQKDRKQKFIDYLERQQPPVRVRLRPRNSLILHKSPGRSPVVEFQFFAALSGALGFQFYSLINVTNREKILGPFLIDKITNALEGRREIKAIFTLDPKTKVSRATEGVVLRLVLNERPSELNDGILGQLMMGYDFLRNIFTDIDFREDPRRWNGEHPDQLDGYLPEHAG